MLIIFEYIYIWLINYIRKTYFDIFKSNVDLTLSKVKLVSLFLYIIVFTLATFLSIIINLLILGLEGHIPPIVLILILFFIVYRLVIVDFKISIKNFYLNDDKWIYRKTSPNIKLFLNIIKVLNISTIKIICLYPTSFLAFFIVTTIANNYSLYTIILLTILSFILYFFAIQLRLSISFFYMLGNKRFSYLKIIIIPCFLFILFWVITNIQTNKEFIHNIIFNIMNTIDVSNIIKNSIYIFIILLLLTTITTYKFYLKASENSFSQSIKPNLSSDSHSLFFNSKLKSFLKKDLLCLYRSLKLDYVNYNYILYSVFFFISLISINKFITIINYSTMINLGFPLYIFFSIVSVLFTLEKIINIESEGNFILLIPMYLYKKIIFSKIIISTTITLLLNICLFIYLFIFYVIYWENLIYIFIVSLFITLILNLSYHLPYIIFPNFHWDNMNEIGTSAKSNILSFIINGFVFSILFSIIMFYYLMTITNRLPTLTINFYTMIALSFLLILLLLIFGIITKKRRINFD